MEEELPQIEGRAYVGRAEEIKEASAFIRAQVMRVICRFGIISCPS